MCKAQHYALTISKVDINKAQTDVQTGNVNAAAQHPGESKGLVQKI